MVSHGHTCITLWTNDPERARWGGKHGVDRIGVDLETLGKEERQRGLETWISPHRVTDIERIRSELGGAQLFVRCNPFHAGSQGEIEELIAHSVEVLMLPNFTMASEVEGILKLVDGRALVVPLVERRASLGCLRSLKSLGIREVHVGLNDLSIDLGIKNRLVVMASGVLDAFAAEARELGIGLGIGGLGRALDAALPVPSDLVYAQHARLGACGALLARSFFCRGMDEVMFASEMVRLRARLAHWRAMPTQVLEQARLELLGFAERPT